MAKVSSKKKKEKKSKRKYVDDSDSNSLNSRDSEISRKKSKKKSKKHRKRKVSSSSSESSLTSSISSSESEIQKIEKVKELKNEVEKNQTVISNDVETVENQVNSENQNIENEIKVETCTDLALPNMNQPTEVAIFNPPSNFIKVNLQEIANFNRKLVVYNLPKGVNDDEIKNYIFTILTTLNPNKTSNPILSFDKKEEGLYYVVELATKDDIEILINMDQTDWRGYRIRIQKPKRFFTDYNDTEGGNIRKRENKNNKLSFMLDSDNKLYMGGIPTTATDNEVRRVVESFGQLKTFNLVKDPNDDSLNRGFCFFEYLDEKVTERAMKGLNNLEMGDKKLRVQKATFGNKTGTIAAQQKAAGLLALASSENTNSNGQKQSNFSEFVPTMTPEEMIDIPLYASLPSRVILLINLIEPEDVMDDLEYREIVEDIRNECTQFGTVLNVEIPRPDKSVSIAGPAVGKIFLKFKNLHEAKKARYKLSGRKYNRRTVIASFYPEHYFDVREFNFQERL